MTTNYHTPIVPGAPANASTFNSPLGQIDQALATRSAEIMAARGGYASLDARLDSIVAAGGNISTLANGAHSAGVSQLVVDSSAGFVVGARIVYALTTGRIEYNQVDSLPDATHINVETATGGGIADNSVVAMISESEYQAANAIKHSVAVTLDTAMAIASEQIYNPVAYGAAGDGTTNDRTVLDALVNSTMPATGGVLLIDRGYRIATGMQIPANVAVRIVAGGYFTIDSGQTLTVKGPLQAGLYQIFQGSGSVVLSSASVEAYPQWWGAKADYGTTNTNLSTSLLKALLACNAVRIPAGSYYFSGSIYVNSNRRLTGDDVHIYCTSRFISQIVGTVSNVVVEKLHIVNLGDAGGGADTNICIYDTFQAGRGFVNSKFKDLILEGWSCGISVYGGAGSVPISDPTGTFTTMTGTDGRNEITGCYIHSCKLLDPPGNDPSSPGIYCRGGYWLVSGNRIEGMCDGILGGENSIISNNRITNIYYGNGVYVSGCEYITITGNYFENIKGDGIACSHTNQTTITGNVLLNVLNGGVRIQDCAGLIISGNYFYGGTGSNIRGTTDGSVSYDVVITSNIFEKSANTEAQCLSYPIKLYTGCYNFQISNNIFRKFNLNGLPAAIVVEATGCYDIRFYDNICDGFYPVAYNSLGQPTIVSETTHERGTKINWSDSTSFDGAVVSGSVRARITSSGITYQLRIGKNNLISNFEKTATGTYLVTFSRRIGIKYMTWCAGGTTPPTTVSFDYGGASDSASQYKDTVTIKTYNSAGTLFDPTCMLTIGVEAVGI